MELQKGIVSDRFQNLSIFSKWSNNQIFPPQNTIGWANATV